jgi:hypothetical protein
MTWDRRLYFPSEGRHAEEFFARQIRRFQPVLNPRTWEPEASMLTTKPLKPLLERGGNNVVGRGRSGCVSLLLRQFYSSLVQTNSDVNRDKIEKCALQVSL